MSAFDGTKTVSGAQVLNVDQINANEADFVYLNVQQNTVLNNLTVTGTVNIPGGLVPANINCQTLTASEFVKAKNNINEYALLQTTASTDPDPNQSILSTSAGSAGLDIITLGTGKKIQLISTECHMVAGYSIFPTLPVGISLFSNTLIALDSILSTTIRASTTAAMTCNLGLTLTGGTTAALTCSQALTLTGGTTTSLTSTSGNMILTSGTTMDLLASGLLKLRAPEMELLTTLGGTGTLKVRGYTATTVESINSSLELTGKTTASLAALDAGVTVTGATTASLTATLGALTLTGGTTASLTAQAGALTLSGATTASLSSTLGLSLTGGTSASLSATAGALTLSGGTTASLSSTSNCSISASAGDVSISASQVGAVGGVIALSSLSPFGTSTNGITLTTGVGGIALTTTAGAISMTTGAGAIAISTGIGGIAVSVAGGAITVGTSLSSISIGTLGDIVLNSSYLVHIISSGGSSSGGIYLNTSASNGSGAAYNWRFPADVGSAGQVLTSQGPGAAQTWSTALTADTNGNVSANNFFSGFLTISTNSINTLTAASPFYIYCTASGGSVQIIFPNATTLPKGAQYYVNTNGTSSIIMKLSGGGTYTTLQQGSYTTFELTDNTTADGTWDHHHSLPPSMTANTASFIAPQPLMTTKAIYASQTAGNTALNCFPLTTNTEASVTFNSQLTSTGAQWKIGQNVAAAGSDSFAIYSSTLSSRTMTMSTTNCTFNNQVTAKSLVLNASTSGTLTFVPPATVSPSWSFIPPTTPGSAGQLLTSSGGGTMTWASPGGSAGSAFTTPVTCTLSGTASGIPYIGLIPTLATGNNVSIQFGASASTNNNGVIYFKNTGGTGSASNELILGLYNNDILTMTPTSAVFRNVVRAQTFQTRPTVSGGESAIGYWGNSDFTGSLWVTGTNVASAGTDTYCIYSNTVSKNNLILTTTTAAFTTPLSVTVSGTASAVTLQNFVPSLANLNTTSMHIGTAATTNNCGVISFLRSSGGGGNNQLRLGLFGNTDALLINATNSTFTTPITSRQTASGNALILVPATTNTECAILFNSSLAQTGPQWVLGQNVASSGTDSLAIFSTTTASRILTITTTLADFTVPLTARTKTASSAHALITFPQTATAECSILFNSQLTATGARWVVGQNIASIGSDIFGIYSTTYGNSVMYIDNSAQIFVRGTINSTGDMSLNTDRSVNNRQMSLYSGSYQNGGIYLNAERTPTYTPLPANGRGSTNIGNTDLGNCLFVGANQEKYVISANGIINVCATATNGQFMTFYDVGTGVSAGIPFAAIGSITRSIGGNTTYNTSSDYRVKKNIINMPSALTLINNLRPVQFSFITDTAETTLNGFIAHEVQEIFPEAVAGEKDAVDENGYIVTQSVSYASFTPILTKAVQELLEKITILEERIALLEGQ